MFVFSARVSIIAAVACLLCISTADAHPNYVLRFVKQYPQFKSKIRKLAKDDRCSVCHYGSKDERENLNDYGSSFWDVGLGEDDDPDAKVPDLKKEHFLAVEKLDSSVEGKTFGDLLKETTFPGTAPKEDE
ncbi:hypothetical protein [Calycomorphotria hydatis]|uniref:Cytochrome c domain-containing protein n=1 Tax=Calycomorphotria hydatis TaxID=2528027 RepID=A0A517TEY5_9PLAN|nr:hypothetical protein [Calycomorphotria hydatis]QDT66929.1 hypothetical protein V22_42010 [Calycomorphotria hydatis]